MTSVKRLCRLCMGGENGKSFSEMFAENNKIMLQVFLLTGIKIEPLANIPALICDDCMKCLCDFGKFRLRCLESNKYFRDISEGKDATAEVYLEDDFQQDVDEVKYEFHGEVEVGIGKLKEEPGNVVTKSSKKKAPRGSLTLKPNPRGDLRKKSRTIVSHRTKKEKNNARYRPMCTFCGKEQESEYRLIQHELLAHTPLSQMSPDDVFVCDLCARIFKTKQSMRNHFIRAHTPSTEKFPCSVCGKVLAHLKALYAHERVHVKSEVTCQYCAKTFDRKVLLSSHIAIVHLKKRLSQCQYCPHQAITGGALKKHIRCKHLNLREHHCDWPDCGKSFHENQHLVRHFRSHTQERPFECRNEGCEKAFSDHAKRSRHEKQNCPRRII